MPKRVPRTRCNGTWTEGQYNSFIKSGLRRMSTRWGPKYEAKKRARHHKKLLNSNNRLVFHSLCAGCNELHPETTCSVDHKEPVIPLTGFVSWDDCIERMFCEVDGLQVLCDDCHSTKTQEEKEERKKYARRLK